MKNIIILILILLVTGCTIFKTELTNQDKMLTFRDYIKDVAYIDTFTIYGKYFNLSGELPLEVSNLILVLKSEELENEYELILERDENKVKFKTNEMINTGIDLEKIKEGEYVFFLKSTNGDEVYYYTLENKTNYDDLTYYTITKNNKNLKMDIKFSKFKSTPFLYLEAKDVNLPSEIYDIVIDPGHGGSDSGASKNGFFESKLNLEYAILLKNTLEKHGLKIKLTRDRDESISNYGDNGRVSIPYQTKAKLMLSIHMNSALNNVGSGGVEIYTAYNSSFKFASSMAFNIVNYTSSSYSKNTSSKVDSGVYMRTLSKSDIKEIEEDAKKGGYKPYEKADTNSTYYYIIRETGGIVTRAYVDLRNKQKEGNKYYNSNHGCEAYLVELGYMNSNYNLKILLEEKDEYVKALEKAILAYLEIS